MRILAISDTHGMLERITADLPEADVLVHAGDLTANGFKYEVRDFHALLAALPYEHKIYIAGNHDFCFEKSKRMQKIMQQKDPSIHYLQDSSVVIKGVKFYGSPWQPTFYNWAFNLDRGEAIRKKWALIEADTDVLITHGPPMGILDKGQKGAHCGCEELRLIVDKIHPKVHIFGHIHEDYGQHVENGTLFVNSCTCNEKYQPINQPMIIDV